jgi:hypothetical protein
MNAIRIAAALGAVSLAAGCQPPAPETTERIIRIQIEGCEDATPLPLLATPTPLALAPTQAAVDPTRVPIETPAVIQPRVERTPIPAARSPESFVEDYMLRRESFLSSLADAKLHPLDVPAAYDSFRRAEDFLRAKNYDEALRYVEVASLEVQSVKIGEPFILQKFKRIEGRLEAARPRMTAQELDRTQKSMAKAHSAFLTNSFRLSNTILYEVDQALDRHAKAEAPKTPPR